MTKCEKCHKNIGAYTYSCHGCEKSFCVRCRIPEDHLCASLDRIKQEAKQQLSKVLNESAIKDSHHFVSNI